MNNKQDWRSQVDEALKARKASEGVTLSEYQADKNTSKPSFRDSLEEKYATVENQRTKLIADVLHAAKIQIQTQMLDEIKNGSSIDEVLKKYDQTI